MSLFFDCGNGYAKTSFARKNLGADAFLCCPGPSLKEVDPVKLKGRGRMIFAINTAYPFVKPDVWMGLDKVECYDRNLWAEPFMKVCRGNYYNTMELDGKPVREFPNVYWASMREPEEGKTMLDYRAHNTFFVWHKNTMAAMIHLMIWMGASNIYLLGCDMGGNKDYYDDRQLPTGQRTYNRRLYNDQVGFIERLAKAARPYGISFISCTPGSPLNNFLPYVHVDEALQHSEHKAAAQPGQILHALDAETPEAIYANAYKHEHYRITAERYNHATAILDTWEPGTVLDVSCGRGEILDYFEKRGFEPKGTEIVDALIDNKRVTYAQTHKLPFTANSFDYLTCLDVIEHIKPEDTLKTFREFDWIARKRILLTISNYPSQSIKGVEMHINIKSYEEWDRIIRENFGGKVIWHPKNENICETWEIIKS